MTADCQQLAHTLLTIGAAVTQRALDAGAGDVVLYTDIANPGPNSIYQRIG